MHKSFIITMAILVTFAIVFGFIIDTAHALHYICNALLCTTMAIAFYAAISYALRVKKEAFFMLFVSTVFVCKVLTIIIYFTQYRKYYFYSKEWAAHLFVCYIVMTFIASIFVGQTKRK